MPAKTRFLELDALRGFAALWVVLFHYTFGVGFFWLDEDFAAAARYTPAIPNLEGLRAVDLFFIISGFVIFMTIQNARALSDFVVSRVSRLFPAFLFAVTLAALLAVLVPMAAQPVTLKQYLVNLTMLEQFLGVPPLDTVYWSLTYELGFYFCIGVIFSLGATRRIELIGFLWVLASFIALKAVPAIGAHIPWRFQALVALPYAALFFSGILFYRVWSGGATPMRIALLLFCYLEYVAFQSPRFAAIITFIYLLFALCVWGRMRFLTWKPFVVLGWMSYPLYLTHNAIGFRIQSLNLALGLPPVANLIVTMLAALAVAAAVTFLIDRPAHAALNRAWRSFKARRADLAAAEGPA